VIGSLRRPPAQSALRGREFLCHATKHSGSCTPVKAPLSFRVRSASAPPAPAHAAFCPPRMLINLLPDFFAVLNSTDRLAAYHRYFAAHRQILEPYWRNYVIDPESPHFQDVARATVFADRSDLRIALDRADVVALARAADQQCRELL